MNPPMPDCYLLFLYLVYEVNYCYTPCMENTRILDMQIASVDPKAWRFKVAPVGMIGSPERHVAAKLLSSTPVGRDGSGMFAVPSIGDPCAVMMVGSRAYILGFYMYHGESGSGGLLPKSGMEEGDIALLSHVGTMIKISMRGGLHLIADSWSRLMLGLTNQEIRGWFRNAYIRMRGGRIDWETSKEDGSARYTSVIADRFEHDLDYDGRSEPTASSTGNDYVNKVIHKVGAGPALDVIDRRGGAVVGDTLPTRRHVEEYMVTEGPEVRSVYSNDAGRVVVTVLDVGDDKYRLEFSSGEVPYCTIRVTENDLTISHTGDIFVGGEGQEQQLATRAFVEDIFFTHTHLDSNLAPTSGPNNVTLTLPESRDSSNHLTYGTKVE